MLKKITPFVALIIAILFLSGCNGNDGEADANNEYGSVVISPYSRTEFLMGTVVTIKIHNEGKEDILDKAFARVEELADKITVNEEGSEMEEINDQAGKSPVQVSDETFFLIREGLRYTRESNGLFDVTIGPLTRLWNIGFDDARKPSQAEIEEVLPLIDIDMVELNEEDNSVFLKKPGMRFDFGALAKGYITDEVVKVLRENHVDTAIIDLGGNIFVMGESPRGGEWTVGIQDPFSEARGTAAGRLRVSDKSIVTSGIYERFLEVDGELYHHILNAETGYPQNNEVAGVTIISDKSIDGDAFTTFAFMKGIEEGMKFVESVDGVEAVFISRDKEVYVTSGLTDIFELSNDEFTLKTK